MDLDSNVLMCAMLLAGLVAMFWMHNQTQLRIESDRRAAESIRADRLMEQRRQEREQDVRRRREQTEATARRLHAEQVEQERHRAEQAEHERNRHYVDTLFRARQQQQEEKHSASVMKMVRVGLLGAGAVVLSVACPFLAPELAVGMAGVAYAATTGDDLRERERERERDQASRMMLPPPSYRQPSFRQPSYRQHQPQMAQIEEVH